MSTRCLLIPLGLTLSLGLAAPALAAEGGKVEDTSFSYEGPFGTFDEMQLQRGFQIFHEVCAACHGLQYLSFRNLGDHNGPNFPDAQVKGIAALYNVQDRETGEDRAGLASDRFPANTGAGAPDLTLMAKARAGFHGPYGTGLSQLINGMGGDEFIYSLLIGYTGEEKEEAGVVLYENTAFPGGWIAMPPPLDEGLVEYAAHGGGGEAEDGHGGDEYHPPEATVEQMSKDVSAFLMWAAEPNMVERKEAGVRNVIVLIILALLLYYTNKKLWKSVKHRRD